MLAKKYRLKKNFEFRITYLQKQYTHSGLCSLNIGKAKPDEAYTTRVAFVVSKKIDKRASKRNLIKRRMREAYRSFLQDENFDFQRWKTMIFMAKKECLNADFFQIKNSMLECIKKALKKYD
ncbi:MAG: ribonuclease P protein component [Candidatus Gastranaerophilales bacterium]|nr:ribonuclease P protein component [Candidatus Gastranaerophilales bacterium]